MSDDSRESRFAFNFPLWFVVHEDSTFFDSNTDKRLVINTDARAFAGVKVNSYRCVLAFTAEDLASRFWEVQGDGVVAMIPDHRRFARMLELFLLQGVQAIAFDFIDAESNGLEVVPIDSCLQSIRDAFGDEDGHLSAG